MSRLSEHTLDFGREHLVLGSGDLSVHESLSGDSLGLPVYCGAGGGGDRARTEGAREASGGRTCLLDRRADVIRRDPRLRRDLLDRADGQGLRAGVRSARRPLLVLDLRSALQNFLRGVGIELRRLRSSLRERFREFPR